MSDTQREIKAREMFNRRWPIRIGTNPPKRTPATPPQPSDLRQQKQTGLTKSARDQERRGEEEREEIRNTQIPPLNDLFPYRVVGFDYEFFGLGADPPDTFVQGS